MSSIKLSISFSKSKVTLKKAGFEYKNFQEEGVKWMLRQELQTDIRGGLLCDDPGLGKTIQTAGLIAGNKVEKTLIVVPTCILYQWLEILEKIFPDWNIYLHYGSNRAESLLELYAKNFDICITTYGCIVTWVKDSTAPTVLHNVYWDRIILDECHIIKNRNSKLFQMCKKFHSKYKWGLTGTPIQNSKKDIKTLIDYVGMNESFCRLTINEIIKNYCIRRNKEILYNIDREFKKYTVKNHVVKFKTPEEQLIYKNIDYSQYVHNSNTFDMTKIETMLRLRQACSHPKIAIESLTKKFKNTTLTFDEISTKMDKTVQLVKQMEGLCIVFCQFTAEIKMLTGYLENEGIRSVHYDSSINQRERRKLLAMFNDNDGTNPEKPKVMFIQIKAGGVGLNLQQFSNVIILSPDWNPSNEIQAIARAHRLGQKRQVHVHKISLISNPEFDIEPVKTIDHQILMKQMSKRNIMSTLLEDKSLVFQENFNGETKLVETFTENMKTQ